MSLLVHVRTMFFVFFFFFSLSSSSSFLSSSLRSPLSSSFLPLSLSSLCLCLSRCLSLSVSVCLCLSPCCVWCVCLGVGRGEGPCVRSKRLRVSIQNVPLCTGITRTCVSTCARGASTHGGRFESTHGGLQRATAMHSHTPQHATSHGDGEREKEDRERRED